MTTLPTAPAAYFIRFFSADGSWTNGRSYRTLDAARREAARINKRDPRSGANVQRYYSPSSLLMGGAS